MSDYLVSTLGEIVKAMADSRVVIHFRVLIVLWTRGLARSRESWAGTRAMYGVFWLSMRCVQDG